MSRARGVEATRPVPGVVLDRQHLIARVREHVEHELPPQAIRDEGLVMQLLGFVPTSFDYEAQEYALLRNELAGYYEPADATMYLAADLRKPEAEATLAHELVHALQDMHWDLKSRSKYVPEQGDKSEAFSALAEGDATSAMFDIMVGDKFPGMTAVDIPDREIDEQIRGNIESGPSAKAPKIMRSSLAASYLYGVLFVHELRRRDGWGEVDRAWNDPPVTTEQILHLDKYDAREPAIVVPTPSAASLGGTWASANVDTYGELGVRIAFEEWMPDGRAALAASGWGGDRGALFKDGSRVAFAWHVRYDPGRASPDELARRAFEAVAPVVRSNAPAQGTPCVERRDRGPLALARLGQDVVIVAGPANVAQGGWSAAGNCSLARAWAAEILGRGSAPGGK